MIVIQARSALKSFANTATLVKDIDEVCVWFGVFFPHCCSCSGQNPWWFCKCNYASKTVLLMIWLILLTGGHNVVKPCWLKLSFSSLNCVCSKGIVWQAFLSVPMPASAVTPPCRLSLGYGFALWLIQQLKGMASLWLCCISSYPLLVFLTPVS